MTVTLLIQYRALEYFIHDVETVGLTLEGVFDRIFSWTNVDAHLFVGKIPKLQGVIPLYADVIDILNDDDLKMVLNIYTDMGNKVVELKFKMEMPDSIQLETSNIVRLGVKEIENVAHHGIQKPNGSHTTLEIPIVAQPGVEEEVQQEFHVNENDSMLSSEIEKEVPCNETEDDSAEDSEDDLSDYKSSDGEKFQGLSDVVEAHTNGMRMLSDEIVGNYFHQSEGNIDELEVGMTFDDVDHFRMVVKNFSIQEDFPLERVKNERSRVALKCQREGCTWRIHASPVGANKKTYQIKSYNSNHTCDPFGDGCKEASTTWIANKMKDDFESNPLTDVNTLGMNLKKRHGVSVSSWKLYRARQKAMDLVSGDHKESYAKIPNYIAALRKIDANIFIGLKCDGLDISNPLSHCRFERLFICFPSQRDGFKYGCGPFIGIDGCFLKGPYGGQLLVATALDANFGIFPLAFMFAEAESESSWGYFLDCLQNYLDDSRCLTFMSDKQKGILKAVKTIYPTASNMYCARHRYNNFKAAHPGPKLKILFWRAVRATNITDFNLAIDEVKRIDQEAWQWLLRDDPKHWSIHAFDAHVKTDHVTNNMTESFNGWIAKHRQLPILSLLEVLRRKCMKRFKSRYQKGETWDCDIPPKVRQKLNLARKAGRHIQGLSNGEEYEVDDDRSYIVSLHHKTCQCGAWQICGISCKHAMACIHNRQADPLHYVHPYFTRSAYLKTYEGKIPTMQDKIHWPSVEHPLILPPLKMRGKDQKGKTKQNNKGRPVVNRRREADEPTKKAKRSTVIHCRKCKKINHNWRTCPQRPENQEKNKKKRKKASSFTKNNFFLS